MGWVSGVSLTNRQISVEPTLGRIDIGSAQCFNSSMPSTGLPVSLAPSNADGVGPEVRVTQLVRLRILNFVQCDIAGAHHVRGCQTRNRRGGNQARRNRNRLAAQLLRHLELHDLGEIGSASSAGVGSG